MSPRISPLKNRTFLTLANSTATTKFPARRDKNSFNFYSRNRRGVVNEVSSARTRRSPFEVISFLRFFFLPLFPSTTPRDGSDRDHRPSAIFNPRPRLPPRHLLRGSTRGTRASSRTRAFIKRDIFHDILTYYTGRPVCSRGQKACLLVSFIRR